MLGLKWIHVSKGVPGQQTLLRYCIILTKQLIKCAICDLLFRYQRRHIDIWHIEVIFVLWLFCICFKFHWILFPSVQLTEQPSMLQIMAYYRRGDKPLSEPMMTQFTDAYIYVIRPQWVNAYTYTHISLFVHLVNTTYHKYNMGFPANYVSQCYPWPVCDYFKWKSLEWFMGS